MAERYVVAYSYLAELAADARAVIAAALADAGPPEAVAGELVALPAYLARVGTRG